jgi:hypothetical protein
MLTRSADHYTRCDEFGSRSGPSWVLFSGDLERKLGRGSANLFTALIDRRQRNTEEIRIREIAASYHCDIFWNVEACIQNGAHRTEGRWVVEAEDSIRSLFGGKQLPGCLVTALFASMVSR